MNSGSSNQKDPERGLFVFTIFAVCDAKNIRKAET